MPDYTKIIEGASSKTGVPADILTRLVQAESSGNSRAVSPKGAQGLTQLMPGTAKELGVTDPFDPEQNIYGGATYLAKMYQQFGSWPLALAAYNAGPGRAREAASWPAVQQYVNKVMGMQNLQQTAQQIINDPQRAALLTQATEAGQKALASRQQATEQVQANQVRSREVLGQIAADRATAPAAPTLQDIPDAPKPKPATNPLQVFGQVMPMMAVLGSALTRGGALSAMKTATAAMTAVKARDAEEVKAAHDRWKDELNRVAAQNDLEMSRYRTVMDNRKLTMDERLAELRAIAAENQDTLALAAFDRGDFDMFTKLIALRDGANKQVFDIISDVNDADEKRRERELRERENAPTLAMGDFINKLRRGEKPDANEWRVLAVQMSGSTADRINYLMLKKEWAGLSATEEANLTSLLTRQGSAVNPAGVPLGGTGGRPGEATAAVPGATTEPAPAAAERPPVTNEIVTDSTGQKYRYIGGVGGYNDPKNYERVPG